jgi:Cu/Ag efflux protein CusF
MKTSIQTVLLVAALVLSATAQEQKESPAQPLSTGAATLASITATVQAVDHGKREVTLKGPLGKMITFVVDKRVQRLNEIKVGDQVRADYYVSLAGELRQPTAEVAQAYYASKEGPPR